jgi:hypothetical protein
VSSPFGFTQAWSDKRQQERFCADTSARGVIFNGGQAYEDFPLLVWQTKQRSSVGLEEVQSKTTFFLVKITFKVLVPLEAVHHAIPQRSRPNLP